MSWIRSATLVLVVSILTIKLMDLGLGILRDTSSDSLSTDQRGIRLREFNPNQTAVIVPTDADMLGKDGLIQKQYRISIDADGFIDNGNPKTEGEFVIAFLGGSTTETMYVDEEERFPSIVERRLREKLSKDVRTINAGVSGNHSLHSLLNFQAKIIPQKPKIAILMHNINDYALLSKTGSYWVAPEGRDILTENKSKNTFGALELIRMIKDILIPNFYNYLEPRLFLGLSVRDEFDGYRENSISKYSRETQLMFEKSLRSFISLSQIWDIKPVLMTQFNRVSKNDPLFIKWITKRRLDNEVHEIVATYNALNDITRKVARDTGTHLIDLDIEIPKTAEYIYDIVHLNGKGSRLAANIISQNLINIQTNK